MARRSPAVPRMQLTHEGFRATFGICIDALAICPALVLTKELSYILHDCDLHLSLHPGAAVRKPCEPARLGLLNAAGEAACQAVHVGYVAQTIERIPTVFAEERAGDWLPQHIQASKTLQ